MRLLRVTALLPIMTIVFGVSAQHSNSVVGGGFLVGIGLLLLATRLTRTASYSRFAPSLSVNLE